MKTLRRQPLGANIIIYDIPPSTPQSRLTTEFVSDSVKLALPGDGLWLHVDWSLLTRPKPTPRACVKVRTYSLQVCIAQDITIKSSRAETLS
jgi:hypothetical protein